MRFIQIDRHNAIDVDEIAKLRRDPDDEDDMDITLKSGTETTISFTGGEERDRAFRSLSGMLGVKDLII